MMMEFNRFCIYSMENSSILHNPPSMPFWRKLFTRATSILCLLGVGIGIGSVILYKFFTRVGSSSPRKERQADASTRSARDDDDTNSSFSTSSDQHRRTTLAACPVDSNSVIDVAKMGVQHSDIADGVMYEGDDRVSIRRYALPSDLRANSVRRRNTAVCNAVHSNVERPIRDAESENTVNHQNLCGLVEEDLNIAPTISIDDNIPNDEMEVAQHSQLQTAIAANMTSEDLFELRDEFSILNRNCQSWKQTYSEISWDAMPSDSEFQTIGCETEEGMGVLLDEIHKVESDIEDIGLKIREISQRRSLEIETASGVSHTLPSRAASVLARTRSLSDDQFGSGSALPSSKQPSYSHASTLKGHGDVHDYARHVLLKCSLSTPSPAELPNHISASISDVLKAAVAPPLTTNNGEQSPETSKVTSGEVSSLNSCCSIGPDTDLEMYAFREWAGKTKNSASMREAYLQLVSAHGFTTINRIRGDNYCALRAALCQMLVLQHPDIVNHFVQPDFGKKIAVLSNERYDFLKDWTFPDDVSQPVHERLSECLLSLQRQIAEISISPQPRKDLALLWNKDPKVCFEAMEAIKALMMSQTISFCESIRQGQDVPLFATLMLIRDTSDSGAAFFHNHLNKIGHEAGVEQIEMFLLAQVLGVRIRCFRLSSLHQSDFVSDFPEEGDQPMINLVAEDDRHYNIIF